jgi:hypothetical protein
VSPDRAIVGASRRRSGHRARDVSGDAALEFPQSGERFEGLESFREWRSRFPADIEFEIRNLRGDGDVWAAESAIRYGGGPWQPGVSIVEFRGDKVAHETIYVTESWEAPEWRARWRSAP